MANDVVQKATIVLFGGTGDLATRKLLPALFHLWKQAHLKNCLIIGIGRRARNNQEYQSLLRERVELASTKPSEWGEFAQSINYHHGDIETQADFEALRAQIERLEEDRVLPGDRLFYYAVGPSWFAPITQRLSAVGLLPRPSPSPEGRWARIVVEKPFGHDLASAMELTHQLGDCVDENQIFRIDHYLGKETVQNVLAFRFANGLFEPVWNQKYVSSVQITVAESLGIGTRGNYYESAGALRDMMANHMMQLLSLTAMEPPISMEANAIRDEKVKVLRAIRLPQSAEEVKVSSVRGQYGPGTVNGEKVVGYRDEDYVAPHSATPTYVATRLYLDNWRWAHVPFFLRHGKRLAKRGTEIAIQFHTPPLALFKDADICGHCVNLLILRIQPDEGITLHFGAKQPGSGMRIANATMDFDYERAFHHTIPEAYERLLLDALLGDPTLFTRSDEVMASWHWADCLLNAWDKLGGPNFPNYAAGSWGPSQAESLFPQGDDVPAGVCPVGWRRW